MSNVLSFDVTEYKGDHCYDYYTSFMTRKGSLGGKRRKDMNECRNVCRSTKGCKDVLYREGEKIITFFLPFFIRIY